MAAHRFAVLALAGMAASALASRPTLRLERIDPTPFPGESKIRIFASWVELEGQVDEGRSAASFQLRIDGKHPIAAEKAEPFRVAAVPLDVVLVIESSALYGVQKLAPPSLSAPPPRPTKPARPQKGRRGGGRAPAVPVPAPVPVPVPAAGGEVPLDRVKEALAALLEGRPAQTRVMVIDYGGEVTAHPPFRPAPAATGAVEDISPDDESGDLHLVDAVRAALVELNRPRAATVGEAPPRRIIVVVSDGLNAQMDRRTFRLLGDAAAEARVPIHSIAYSPGDDRGPLLNLGEISKRSNGTFRWARTAEDLKAQIDLLADELDKQYVLTFAVPVDKLEGHAYELACDGLRSNALRYEPGGSIFGYAGPTTRRGLLWTILYWAGAIAGGLVVVYLGFAVALRLASRPRRVLAGGAALHVLDGRHAGRAVPLDPGRRLAIGKTGALALDDPAASTRHAELAFDGRGWVIVDLGSTNGTWVDGQRIAAPTYLSSGSVIQIGQTRLRMVI